MGVMPLNLLQLVGILLLATVGCDRSLTFDCRKAFAHGTGEKLYHYRSGGPKLREEYVDGELVRSRWFKPDGALVHETKWADGTGEGIHLREDGSIRTRMRYVKGTAEGEAKEYDEAGIVTKVVQYRGGRARRRK